MSDMQECEECGIPYEYDGVLDVPDGVCPECYQATEEICDRCGLAYYTYEDDECPHCDGEEDDD